MKNLHPDDGPVVFSDPAAGVSFLSRSTAGALARSTVVWEDGETYPAIHVVPRKREVPPASAASHPFWTGKSRVLDAEGRVERFRRRYGRRTP